MTLLTVIILIVVILQVLSGSLSYVTTAFSYLSSNMSAGGIGFAGFFAAGGLMYLILGATVLILVISMLFMLFKGGKER
ncbi:MAG: hypothetical protein NTV63_02440 [Candidatus Woesearchaeota archaeon]|nr:hypothetical protein [Candidatus Woesearchaeota archaeon]